MGVPVRPGIGTGSVSSVSLVMMDLLRVKLSLSVGWRQCWSAQSASNRFMDQKEHVSLAGQIIPRPAGPYGVLHLA